MPARRPPPPIDQATITQEQPPAPTTASTITPEAVKATEVSPEASDGPSGEETRLLALLGDSEALKAEIDLDLANVKARTRGKIVNFLVRTAVGDRFIEAAESAGITWPSFGFYEGKYPLIRQIYTVSKVLGKSMRQCRREIELDRRGVKGIDKPVFYKGVQVATIKEYSDKCLELALKGGDTDGKYIDRSKVETTGQAVVYHIHGVDRTPVDKLERPDILDV